MTASEARRHLAYSEWASRRLFDVVMALPAEQRERDLGSAHRCVLDTLAHIVFADRVWLKRVMGTAVPGAEAVPSEAVAVEWPRLWRQWADLAAGWTDAELAQVIEYPDLRGAARASTLEEMVMHVVNHATLHRGQVSGMLRQMGVAPPQTDLIVFYREHK
jgi:uncharacterized damage-inducible protein DinB